MDRERGRRQTAIVPCPKSMVGRVIGRNGETIKALQTFTGALIQIDQTSDPTKIAISGTPQSLNLALSMVNDIVRGNFKGFALLRQATGHSSRGPQPLAAKPVYAPGYGLIPPSQLYGGEGSVLLPGAGGLPALPHSAAAAGAGVQPHSSYPQILGAGPQYMMGMQPMAMAGPSAAPGGAVYSVVSSPAYTGPVYYSPVEYATGAGMPLTQIATASGVAPASALGGGGSGGGPSGDFTYVSDPTHMLGGGGGAAGGGIVTGSRLFHSVAPMAPALVARGAGQGLMAGGQMVGAAGVGGGGGAAASGQLLGPAAFAAAAGGGAGGGPQRVSLSVGPASGGGAGGGAGVGMGGAATGLLPPNSLVMDADGALYTYNPDA